MASEDSDEVVPGFTVIHRLRDFSYLDKTLSGQMPISCDDFHASCELLEVMLLRRPHRIPAKERDDRLDQFRTPAHVILA